MSSPFSLYTAEGLLGRKRVPSGPQIYYGPCPRAKINFKDLFGRKHSKVGIRSVYIDWREVFDIFN